MLHPLAFVWQGSRGNYIWLCANTVFRTSYSQFCGETSISPSLPSQHAIIRRNRVALTAMGRSCAANPDCQRCNCEIATAAPNVSKQYCDCRGNSLLFPLVIVTISPHPRTYISAAVPDIRRSRKQRANDICWCMQSSSTARNLVHSSMNAQPTNPMMSMMSGRNYSPPELVMSTPI